jgi:hypothetical protein
MLPINLGSLLSALAAVSKASSVAAARTEPSPALRAKSQRQWSPKPSRDSQCQRRGDECDLFAATGKRLRALPIDMESLKTRPRATHEEKRPARFPEGLSAPYRLCRSTPSYPLTTPPSPPRPCDARGRRSFAFVGEDHCGAIPGRYRNDTYRLLENFVQRCAQW